MEAGEIRETSLSKVMRPQHFAVHRAPQVEIISDEFLRIRARVGIKATPANKRSRARAQTLTRREARRAVVVKRERERARLGRSLVAIFTRKAIKSPEVCIVVERNCEIIYARATIFIEP